MPTTDAPIWWHGGEMENIKRKIDRRRRSLEELTLEMTLERKQAMDAFDFKKADRLGKSLEVLAVANHNLWLATVPL